MDEGRDRNFGPTIMQTSMGVFIRELGEEHFWMEDTAFGRLLTMDEYAKQVIRTYYKRMSTKFDVDLLLCASRLESKWKQALRN